MSIHAGNHKVSQATVTAAEDNLSELPYLLSQMGDGRSTQRLLNVLSRLEAYHANLAAANTGAGSFTGAPAAGRGAAGAKVVSGTAITSELHRLTQENRILRQRQRNAVERLDALLGRLPHLLDDAATNEKTAGLVETITLINPVQDEFA